MGGKKMEEYDIGDGSYITEKLRTVKSNKVRNA